MEGAIYATDFGNVVLRNIGDCDLVKPIKSEDEFWAFGAYDFAEDDRRTVYAAAEKAYMGYRPMPTFDAYREGRRLFLRDSRVEGYYGA